MGREPSEHDEGAELWRGARLAAVAIVTAFVTAAGVISAGQALLPAARGEAVTAAPILIRAER